MSTIDSDLHTPFQLSLGNRHCFLIGCMGVGKTTLGNILAEIVNVPFIDTDSLIEATSGMSIAEIFSSHGASYFRALEHICIQEHLPRSGSIIACGGGLPVATGMLTLLKSKGAVIALTASVEVLWTRLKDTGSIRPLLQTSNPYETLKTIYMDRVAIYNQVDICISTDTQSFSDTIDLLKNYLIHSNRL